MGGTLGIALVGWVMGSLFNDPPVHTLTQRPQGPAGELVAFTAETLISFLLMATILILCLLASSDPFHGIGYWCSCGCS